jgi:hypothetical protein
MRAIHLVPLTAGILLTGCGSADADGDGRISPAEAAAEAAKTSVRQRPGEYQYTFELLDFQVPDVPDAARQRMRDAVANGLGGGYFQCVTPADVAEGGAAKMIESLAKSDCTMTEFSVSSDSYTATARCVRRGVTQDFEMEGVMAAESATATVVVSQNVPNLGAAKTTFRLNARRFGECAR